MIGIICATDDELNAVRAIGVEAAPPQLFGGEAFYTLGIADGARAVVTRTQIGKVNAAVAATLLLAHPDLACSALIVVGVGGGLADDLAPGDTVIAGSVGCHDYGAVDASGMTPVTPGTFPLNGPRAQLEDVGEPARAAAEGLLASPEAQDRRPGWRLRLGGIVTGDLFISSDAAREGLRRNFGADVVDMESHAVFQVAQRFGRPVIILRSVSDGAGANANHQYLADLAHTCDRAASFVPALLRILVQAGLDQAALDQEES